MPFLFLAKHDPSRNEYQKKYQLERYHKRKKQAFDMLGGKCSKCGTTRNLELDHKDPSSKSFTLTKLWSVPEEEFKAEVRKCRVLCRKHHLEHTGKQREKGVVKSVPGKSQYDSKNRKKASLSLRLARVATHMEFRDAAGIGAAIAKTVAGTQDGVKVLLGSDFNRTQRVDRPVLTWNVFEKDAKYQVLFTVYGRDKDADVVASLLSHVKEALSEHEVQFEYENDLSEPGLTVKAVSGLCQ